MSEFAPGWWNVRMSKAQVKQYIKNMKEAQIIAKAKLENAKANWEFEKEENELAELEKKMEDYFN